MSMLIEVWGSYGCFTRPEMKTERVSYDMITPSAARGLVEAIYWHPGLRYTVDRIYLLKPFGLDPEDEASTEEYTQRPIRFTNIRRNEDLLGYLGSKDKLHPEFHSEYQV